MNNRSVIYTILFCLTITACKKNSGLTSYNDKVETELQVNIPVPGKVNNVVGGYYVSLPSLYNKTTKSYPTILYLHGAGQYGNGTTDLHVVLDDGLAKVINDKKFPASFHVSKKDFSFIVLSPNLSRFPSAEEVVSFIDFAKAKYRIDPSRLYVSGLSLGGFATTDVASRYPAMFAAAVPMAGMLTDIATCENIARNDMPVWAFHNNNDPTINSETARVFTSQVNSFHPQIPVRLTIFQGYVHDAWTQALDPLYKEGNQNIYEWMLQYTR